MTEETKPPTNLKNNEQKKAQQQKKFFPRNSTTDESIVNFMNTTLSKTNDNRGTAQSIFSRRKGSSSVLTHFDQQATTKLAPIKPTNPTTGFLQNNKTEKDPNSPGSPTASKLTPSMCKPKFAQSGRNKSPKMSDGVLTPAQPLKPMVSREHIGANSQGNVTSKRKALIPATISFLDNESSSMQGYGLPQSKDSRKQSPGPPSNKNSPLLGSPETSEGKHQCEGLAENPNFLLYDFKQGRQQQIPMSQVPHISPSPKQSGSRSTNLNAQSLQPHHRDFVFNHGEAGNKLKQRRQRLVDQAVKNV